MGVRLGRADQNLLCAYSKPYVEVDGLQGVKFHCYRNQLPMNEPARQTETGGEEGLAIELWP